LSSSAFAVIVFALEDAPTDESWLAGVTGELRSSVTWLESPMGFRTAIFRFSANLPHDAERRAALDDLLWRGLCAGARFACVHALEPLIDPGALESRVLTPLLLEKWDELIDANQYVALPDEARQTPHTLRLVRDGTCGVLLRDPAYDN
jgi:hypothetical protein